MRGASLASLSSAPIMAFLAIMIINIVHTCGQSLELSMGLREISQGLEKALHSIA